MSFHTLLYKMPISEFWILKVHQSLLGALNISQGHLWKQVCPFLSSLSHSPYLSFFLIDLAKTFRVNHPNIVNPVNHTYHLPKVQPPPHQPYLPDSPQSPQTKPNQTEQNWALRALIWAKLSLFLLKLKFSFYKKYISLQQSKRSLEDFLIFKQSLEFYM